MKREKLAAAGLVSALVLTGCSQEAPSHPEYKGRTASTGAQLPREIARLLPDNILRIETDDIDGKARGASAVRVAIGNKALVFTAAHMLNGATKHCEKETITQHAVNQYVPARQTKVRKSSDAEWDAMNWQDAAAIQATDPVVGSDEGVSPSAHKPRPGTKVVMANYQDLPDGNGRSADDGQAIFDGVVVGTFKDKLVVASGEGKSYGHVDDFKARTGSSGGAAIIADKASSDYGKLAGLTIATWVAEQSSENIAQQFGYDGLKDGTYTIGFVEPITQEIGQDLAADMVSCSSLS